MEAGQAHYAATEEFKSGLGRYAVGVVFGIEHAIIIVGLAITFLVPDWPEAVQNEVCVHIIIPGSSWLQVARREYNVRKEAQRLRTAQRSHRKPEHPQKTVQPKESKLRRRRKQ